MDLYYNSFFSVQYSQKVTANCAMCTFINKGTAPATIDNSLTLATNEFISFDGKKDEQDITTYTITFGAGTANLVLVRKYYTGSGTASYIVNK